VIRWACDLAVGCGVRRRPMARLLSARFLMPMPTSASTRGSDDMGAHGPTPEARRPHLWALTPATACHLDGSAPLGTAHGVMVRQEAPERLLITHEAASETGAEARHFRPHVKARGLQVTAAVSEDAPRFTAALTAVWPPARFQADHVPTVKQSWGHLTTSR
jgi:hypothetical protein